MLATEAWQYLLAHHSTFRRAVASPIARPCTILNARIARGKEFLQRALNSRVRIGSVSDSPYKTIPRSYLNSASCILHLFSAIMIDIESLKYNARTQLLARGCVSIELEVSKVLF
jgi:hypothetical protein